MIVMTHKHIRSLKYSLIKIRKFGKQQSEDLSVIDYWFNVGNYGLLEIAKHHKRLKL